MAALALRSLDRSYILSAIGVILFVVASLVLTSLVTPTLVFPIVQLPLPSNPSSRQSTTAVDCVIPNVSPLNDVTNSTGPSSCDLFRGQWVADSDLDPPKVPPFNCPIRNPPWNCEDNHKPAPLTQSLVWKPDGCALRPYGDTAGLESLRGKTVGCLGDSLCHNFHETLVCQVMEHDPETHPIEPGFATRVFVSPRFNVTMVWCASEYLVYRDGRESSFEEAGVIRKGSDHYLVHVDVIDPVVARCLKILDVAVFTTGQWWLGKPKVYMLGGSPADLSMTGALAGGLRTLTNHVLTSSFRGLPIFQTISPSHFFGGAWNTAGKCPMKVLSDEEIAGNAREYGGEHTLKVWRTQTEMIRDGSVFELMDVFTVSEARSDGHPGNFTPGGHWDCVHWCEPGVVDTWVQLFYAMVEVSKLSLGSTRG